MVNSLTCPQVVVREGSTDDMANQKLCHKDDFGYNAHEIYDIMEIMGARPGAIRGNSPGAGGDHAYAESDTVNIRSMNGITVRLGRKVRKNKDYATGSVFSVESVEADTQEDIDEFVKALEGLEAVRARGIINSWENEGWSTAVLRTLSNRHIMVVDSTLDVGSDAILGRKYIKHVDLLSAFENSSGLIETVVTHHVTEQLPERECVEYIATVVGAFEFASLDAARIARDTWGVFHNNENIMECLAWGLVRTERIRQIPKWTSWDDLYSFTIDYVPYYVDE